MKLQKMGKKRLGWLKKQVFDVALIDVQLPDMSGLELLEELKKAEVGSRMVKIIITGFPSLKSAIEAVNSNANGYIFKPIDAWKLLKVIRKRLNEKTNDYIRAYGSVR